jgi:hypothetical protein
MATYAPPMDYQIKSDVHHSAVSWAAVLAGSVVFAALALILVALGAGFGLSLVSPWSNVGASASTIGKMGVGWLVLTQVIASVTGGYLAGRLRTKWVSIHTDEVYFRDTAHGFLVWAVGVVISASLLGSAAMAMSGLSGSPEARNRGGGPAILNYFVDTLLRSERPNAPGDSGVATQIETILIHGLAQPNFPASDQAYLTEVVVARSGLNQTDAQNRVNTVISDARQAEDQARKATAHLLLWTFLALLIGAFCASYAATIGGKQRDEVKMSNL